MTHRWYTVEHTVPIKILAMLRVTNLNYPLIVSSHLSSITEKQVVFGAIYIAYSNQMDRSLTSA